MAKKPPGVPFRATTIAPPTVSYADIARKVASEKAPFESTANLPNRGKNNATESKSKAVSKPVVRPESPSSRFVPSLGGVVRSEKREVTSRSSTPSTLEPIGTESTECGKSIVVLVSNQSFKREVTVQQNKLLSALDGHGISYKVIDGADPSNKEQRNNLFAISGLRGQYPQIFVADGTDINFWGDFERFEDENDSGTLPLELGGSARVNTTADVPEATAPVETQGESISSRNPEKGAMKPSIVVLISRQSIDRAVIANQDRTFSILAANELAYEAIDGGDPANKQVRDDLFELSGIRAKYPQFFLIRNGAMEFWGDWDRFDSCNEDGSLQAALVFGPEQAVPPVPSAVAKSDQARPVRNDTVNDTQTPTAEALRLKSVAPRTEETTRAPHNTESKGFSANSTGARDVGLDTKSTAIAVSQQIDSTEITFYGATSFVAKHALDYLMQVSVSLPGERTITLAGRSETKLVALQANLTKMMSSKRNPKAKHSGQCIFDIFVADCSDAIGLQAMARRTKIVLNFAGPFGTYGENVVAACAKLGTDYVDITGETSWAGYMRSKYSDVAGPSGARIISFCGFDSVPSDLAVFAAILALRRAMRSNVDVESATCWHSSAGLANGGTIQTVVGMPLNMRRCFARSMPFLLDDPLVLTHPEIKDDPTIETTKNRMAKAEWLNQLPSFDSVLSMGVSAPFFMAPVNSKIVYASSLALGYGKNFVYRERFLPLGIQKTRKLSILSIIPAVATQLGLMFAVSILKTPFLGKFLADWLFPPGSGSPDSFCKSGFAEVYSEVTTAPNSSRKVNRANCSIKFEGDPGNWVTAQCVVESALALLLEKDKLPARSKDGFGTPAELLGPVLLNRLQKSSVRPVKIVTNARKGVDQNETAIYDNEGKDF
jgi:short subunit dehydrogenase-like uncharacterized protein